MQQLLLMIVLTELACTVAPPLVLDLEESFSIEVLSP